MAHIPFPLLSDISEESSHITNMEDISLFNLSDETLDEPLEPSHNDWILSYIYENGQEMSQIIFSSLEILYVVRDYRGFTNDINDIMGKNSDTIKNHPLLTQLSSFNNDELDDVLRRTVKIMIFITMDTMNEHIPSEDLIHICKAYLKYLYN